MKKSFKKLREQHKKQDETLITILTVILAIAGMVIKI